MLRRGFAIVLALGLLGGCLAPASSPVPSASAEALDPEAWSVDLDATPEGALAGVWVAFPEGSVQGGDNGTIPTLALECAFVAPDGTDAPVTESALLAFQSSGGRLNFTGAGADVPYDLTTYGAGAASTQRHVPSAAPRVLDLTFESVPRGPVGLVVAARASATTPTRFVFRVLHDPRQPARADAASLLASLHGAPTPLPAQGRGTGFAMAEYVEVQEGLPGIAFGGTVLAAGVQVDGGALADVRPLGSVRDETIRAAFSSPEGWGAEAATHVAVVAAGVWDFSGEVRGTPVHASGLDAGFFTLPLAGAAGEGAGSLEGRFHLVGAFGALEIIGFVKEDLGATLPTLLGQPAAVGEVDTGLPIPLPVA